MTVVRSAASAIPRWGCCARNVATSCPARSRSCPEQIQLHGARPTDAALIDPWGRVHRLEIRTLVGRQIEGLGLAILEPSVSRHHAHLTLDDGAWTLRDLGSANGTFQDDKMIEGPVPVQSRDRVRFGHIAFYIVEDVRKAAGSKRITRTVTTTIRPPNLAPVVPPPHAEPRDRLRRRRRGAHRRRPPRDELQDARAHRRRWRLDRGQRQAGAADHDAVRADGADDQAHGVRGPPARARARVRAQLGADRGSVVGHARAEREPRETAGAAGPPRADEERDRRPDRVAASVRLSAARGSQERVRRPARCGARACVCAWRCRS